MFVQMALNSASGFVMQYANFMMARSYLVYDDNNINVGATDTAAEEFALEDVLSSIQLGEAGRAMLQLADRTEFIVAGDPDRKYEYVGFVSKVKKRFSMLSVLAGPVEAEMISEAFLGREPTKGNCARRICEYVMDEHIEFNCTMSQESLHITSFDNGC